ncbi:hypothetical protein AADZ86_02595 [Colwelliaceae bacterium BS250]
MKSYSLVGETLVSRNAKGTTYLIAAQPLPKDKSPPTKYARLMKSYSLVGGTLIWCYGKPHKQKQRANFH